LFVRNGSEECTRAPPALRGLHSAATSCRTKMVFQANRPPDIDMRGVITEVSQLCEDCAKRTRDEVLKAGNRLENEINETLKADKLLYTLLFQNPVILSVPTPSRTKLPPHVRASIAASIGQSLQASNDQTRPVKEAMHRASPTSKSRSLLASLRSQASPERNRSAPNSLLLDKSIESGERNKKQGKKKVEKEEKEENQEEEEEEEERRDTCALGDLEGAEFSAVDIWSGLQGEDRASPSKVNARGQGGMDIDVHDVQISRLEAEVHRLKLENSDLKKAQKEGSESRLRAVMTSATATADELRGAIASVEAVLSEARRELNHKQSRERRAAYEQLHHAIDKAEEDMLEEAILAAQKSEVDDEDILKAQNKLLELQMMSPEERAAGVARKRRQQRKKDAFQLVKKDDAERLAALLDNLEEGENWQDWRDYSGRTLVRCAAEVHAPNAKELLTKRTKVPESIILRHVELRQSREVEDPGLWSSPHVAQAGSLDVQEEVLEIFDEEEDKEKPDISDEEAEKLKAQALRAVVQDDCPSLAKVLKEVRRSVWSRWQNRAGKDLLTLSQERGSSMVYSMLAKSLGMVKEVKRESYEERQTVWVFANGDIQPRRATVLEDTPEESDDVLLEFWDGDDPPERVERCLVHAMGS
ncbi:Hypothetical protein SCF082_LOCUS27194, partial [Durusdinium trenchii]